MYNEHQANAATTLECVAFSYNNVVLVI